MTTPGDGLPAFITARLDEDEAMAKAAQATAMPAGELAAQAGPCVTDAGYDHIARHDPARVLREVAAKRAMVALHAANVTKERQYATPTDIVDGKPPWWDECLYDCVICGWFTIEDGGCDTIRHLASAWSDHPDYRAEWAPGAR